MGGFTLKSTNPIALVLFVATCVLVGVAHPSDDSDGELIQLVANLLTDKDKDIRALGLEQVRSQAKGASATKQFAALLPKLPPDSQVGLLGALGDRGDGAARPAVLELLSTSRDESVRAAALAAMGHLGDPADVPLLAGRLVGGPKAQATAARAALLRLRGEGAVGAIVAEMKSSLPPVRVALIDVLAARRAAAAVPELVSAAADENSTIRMAAMSALAQIAAPEHLEGMVQGVLKAEKGAERTAAERAVALAAARIAQPDRRAATLLSIIDKMSPEQRIALLPMLGRVGGRPALAVIESEIAREGPSHDSAVRALCNWPDATIAPRLIALHQGDAHAEHRGMALAALIRVAPLPDKRPDGERLDLVRKVMALCTTDEERNQLLHRVRAIRTVDALRFVVPYLNTPALAQKACESVVELAHHRTLREANKAEFHKALDEVIKISKDPTVIERANRYKRNQTWAKPTTSDGS
jgi:HEAT repeat protein